MNEFENDRDYNTIRVGYANDPEILRQGLTKVFEFLAMKNTEELKTG